MQKEATNHIIYAIVLIIVVSGIVFYQQKSISNINLSLDKLTSKIDDNTNRLQSENDLLLTYIGDIKTDINKENATINLLQADLSQLRSKTSKVEEQVSTLQLQNNDFSSIIPQVLKSTVVIKTDVGIGSGFIIDPAGYIATNYHVVEDATAGFVSTSDGVIHRVKIVGYNKLADIAVLKIDGSFDAILFADSDSVKTGQKVIAVGSPNGFDFTVTEGIVSATHRKDPNTSNIYIQIDAALNPGNSGGPLVDGTGKVVGMNTLKVMGQEGIGFALEGNQVQSIVWPMVDADKHQ